MDTAVHGWKKKFITIWSGQAVSILTSSVIQMAIIWYITYKTGSAAILSLSTLAAFVPQAVLGPFIGVLIDRWDRKKTMILADAFIALSSLALVASGFSGEIPVGLIMAVLFSRSVGTAFHTLALQAVTPLFVPREQLTKYAGYSQSFESISLIASPALAALLYGFWSLGAIILLDVGGALVAAVTLGAVKIPKVQAEKEAQPPNLMREAKEGIRILKKEQGLPRLLFISAVYAMICFPIGTLYPLMIINYFGGTYVASGIVEVVFSAGLLAGSLALGVWGGRINKMNAITASIAAYGLGLLFAGLLPRSGLVVFIALSLMMGLSAPFFTGVLTSIFQMKIKEEYLGRVLSLLSSLSMVAMPLGLILSGTFAETIGVEKWFFISGCITVALSLFSLRAKPLLN
ncbi:MAG: MFS transporter [Christensenellales bacterium]